jgi:hypothetical protein
MLFCQNEEIRKSIPVGSLAMLVSADVWSSLQHNKSRTKIHKPNCLSLPTACIGVYNQQQTLTQWKITPGSQFLPENIQTSLPSVFQSSTNFSSSRPSGNDRCANPWKKECAPASNCFASLTFAMENPPWTSDRAAAARRRP